MSTRSIDSGMQDIRCAFCGKPNSLAECMIEGPNEIYICDQCITVCADTLMHEMMVQHATPEMLEELKAMPGKAGEMASDVFDSIAQSSSQSSEQKESVFEGLKNLPTPQQLYQHLSDHVVGQEEAKRALSVAVYNHYKRITMDESAIEDPDLQDVEIDKSNILLLGPTGSGKTLLAQTLARTLQVPFAIADATTLTEAGYVGEDVENILLKLITAADYDLELAEIGIIYIDEIDKIARKAENLSITRDVSGEGVQQALLKIVEGSDASVPPQGGRKHPEQELLHLNTKNILFILGGAFVGLPEIIGQRVGKKGLGFTSEVPESKKQADAALLSEVLPEDLNKFGMIPEFVGRIPVITALHELTEEELMRILTEPKNALIKQYTKMFAFEDSELVVEQEALQAIAHEAVEHGTGARGLRSICERILTNVMYELPEHKGGTKVVICATDVTGETTPTIQSIKEKKQTKQSA